MSTIVITQLRNLLLFAMVLRAHSQTLRGRGSDCLIHDFIGNYLLLNRCFDLFLLLITATFALAGFLILGLCLPLQPFVCLSP
jgi:hypothetical protein